MRSLIKATLSCAAASSLLATTLLLASPSALAGNTVSQGGGVKCYWVVVSSNPATGTYVYNQVCRKGGA